MGELTTDGNSRRDLIKKGAVAGGIIWAAPVLLSSPAMANSHGSGVQAACTTYYFAKFVTQDSPPNITNSCSSGVGAQDCFGAGSGNNPSPGPGFVAGRTYLDGCGTTYPPESNTLAPVDRSVIVDARLNKSPTGCVIRNLTGYTKGGSGTGAQRCAAATVTAIAPTPGGMYPNGAWQVSFPAGTATGGFSHIELSFCC